MGLVKAQRAQYGNRRVPDDDDDGSDESITTHLPKCPGKQNTNQSLYWKLGERESPRPRRAQTPLDGNGL